MVLSMDYTKVHDLCTWYRMLIFFMKFLSNNSRRVIFLARMGVDTPENLFGASGPTWRRQRRIINPTFSFNKMKLMLPTVIDCVETLMNKLSILTDEQQEFNIYDIYKRMTMDIICEYIEEH